MLNELDFFHAYGQQRMLMRKIKNHSGVRNNFAPDRSCLGVVRVSISSQLGPARYVNMSI